MVLVRFVHVVSAVFWAGAGIMVGWFVLPATRDVGPSAAPVMQAIIRRRLPDLASLASLLTVGAGLWLWVDRGVSFSNWRGWVLGVGALAGISGAVLGVGFQRPTAQKLALLGAEVAAGGQPPSADQTAEMGKLSGQLARYASRLAELLAVAVGAMALAT
ncbi:MAG TPA: hypothetical protein VJ398_03970 [Acidimicrobiia bacterium]|nr:hypothetical protein [Acidimicrobiia bacterium]